MLTLSYRREAQTSISGVTAGLARTAAQQTVGNVIKLRQRMSPDTLAIVNEIAHPRGMTFLNDDHGPMGLPSSPHAAMAALTEGLTKIVKKKFDGQVISVGGSAADYLYDGYHVCQLDNDGRNEQRYEAYASQARHHKDRGPALLADVLARNTGGGDAMCFGGAENCKRSANILYFNNSHYDMSFAELSRIMIAHGTKRAFMVGIHPREMLIPGILNHESPAFKYAWRRSSNRLEADADGTITLGFTDGSNAYVHKADEYTKWLTTTCWSSGHINLILECDFWGPCAIIQVTMTNRPANISRFIPFDHPIVVFLDFKHYAMENFDSDYIPQQKYHQLDAQIYTNLENYAASKTDVAWTFASFAGYLKAQASVLTIVDGEFRHYGGKSKLHSLNNDGLISIFIWLSAQRAQRTQLVGKAFRAIADELSSTTHIHWKIINRVMRNFNHMRRVVTPTFIEELMRLSPLVEPRLQSEDGVWVSAVVKDTKAGQVYAPYVHIDVAEVEETTIEIDRDVASEAIREYKDRIAPLELSNAEAEIATRGEADPDVAMFKVIAAASRAALTSEIRTFEGGIEIVEGGPGTGKTQFEAENILNEDLIFVPTRAAKQDLEARLKMLNKSNLVYTNHAGIKYAIRDAGNKHEGAKLWVDEAFLQYPGSALLAAASLRVNTIVFVGDSKQIRAKDFLGAGVNVFTQHFLPKASVKSLRNNYRNPAQMVDMLNQKFGYAMIAKSPVLGSMEAEEYDSVEDFWTVANQRRFGEGWRVLTFTQQMKAWFKTRQQSANTVHEFQGCSDRRVALIVTNDLEQTFLDDMGYFIVGFSRSTEKLLICKIRVVEGVEFREIKIGNTDLEALTDLFSPVACAASEPESRIVDLPATSAGVHFNHNYSIGDIALVFDAYWMAAHPYTHHIRSVYKTRLPNTAEQFRVRPQLIESIEKELEVAVFGDYTYLADQDGSNALAMIETFMARNGGSRILMDRSNAMKIARTIVDQTRRKLFAKPITPLTIDELSLAFERFVRKMIERKKQDQYIEADVLDLDRLTAFMKTQLKSKWEPTRENFETMYKEVQKPIYGAAMEGKAGQGVLGWSKPLCYVFASWINAIEARYIKELRPFVIYATQMNDSELVGRINSVLNKYHKCVLIKGDDVCIIYTDAAGKMRAISWDAAQFDASQASVAMCIEVIVMLLYGLPPPLANFFWRFVSKANTQTLGRILQMVLHFSKHSGGIETLWGNSNYSMSLIGLVMDFDDHGDWREAKFSQRGMTVLKEALGTKLKVHDGVIGDFVGFIIQDYKMNPDIFRLAAKVLNRRFTLAASVTKSQREAYIQECPSITRAPGLVSLYHSVVEYSVAVRDRLASITTEQDKLNTIRANAAYYMPEVPLSEAMAKVSLMLDALATFGNRRFVPIFFEELRRRVRRMHIMPIENREQHADLSHVIANRDICDRVLIDLRLLDNVIKPVETYQYEADPGWFLAMKQKVKQTVSNATKSAWGRLLEAIDTRIRRSRFAARLWWLTWLINKVRPKTAEPLEEVVYGDGGAGGDDADEEMPPIEDAHPARFDTAATAAAQGMVDYFEATEKRVIDALKADPKCTKTFAAFKGKRKYESGAAYKLLDVLVERQEMDFSEPANMLTVCDIGSAPGGCAQVFCEFEGISRVIALNLPADQGGLRMRYENPKVDYREVDVNTVGKLPTAEFYFCDIQNIQTSTALRFLREAEEKGVDMAMKFNGLSDEVAEYVGERTIILKPQRSNRYSSEFYVLTYPHENATTLAMYIGNWAAAIGDLESRHFPTPVATEDNELIGHNTHHLSVAFETITGNKMAIRSTVQLSDVLRKANINHTITLNRTVVHEYVDGTRGRHWEIDLDSEEVVEVEDRKRNRRDNQEAADGGEGESATGDEMEPNDWLAPGALFSPIIRAFTLRPVAQSEIVFAAPIMEETIASVMSYLTPWHPAGTLHAIFGCIMAITRKGEAWTQFLPAYHLISWSDRPFVWRLACHMLMNYLSCGGHPIGKGVMMRMALNLLMSRSRDGVALSMISAALDFMTKNYLCSGVLLQALAAQPFCKNMLKNVRSGFNKFLLAAGAMQAQTTIYGVVRELLPSRFFYALTDPRAELRSLIPSLVNALENMGIDRIAPPPDDATFVELNEWVTESNNLIMKNVARLMGQTGVVQEVNSAAIKMNIPAAAAFAPFAPVGPDNKLDVLNTFDGPQPVKPIDFNGAQPVQPITFAAKQPVFFPESQPTHFEEAQHVIVDKSAADRILGFLGSLATLVVKNGEEQGAFRIAPQPGLPIAVVGASDIPSGGTADVNIIGIRGGLNLPIYLKGAEASAWVSTRMISSDITMPVKIMSSDATLKTTVENTEPILVEGVGSQSGDAVDGYVTAAWLSLPIGSIGSYWLNDVFDGFVVGQGSSGERLSAALRRLGFTNANDIAIKRFTMRFSAWLGGFSDPFLETIISKTTDVTLRFSENRYSKKYEVNVDVGETALAKVGRGPDGLAMVVGRKGWDFENDNTLTCRVKIYRH